MIQGKNISLKNGREKVLENLDFEFPEGQITALYGPTGSGKTVLLLIFAGLMKPSSGELMIDGLNVVKKPRVARRQIGLGIIPGFSPMLAKLTLKENLLLHARTLKVEHPMGRVQELLKWLQVEEYAHALAEDLTAFVCAKASLALALLTDPSTLLLDEPEYRLTSEETEMIWGFLKELRELRKCVVVSTRYQEVAAKCDKTFNIS